MEKKNYILIVGFIIIAMGVFGYVFFRKYVGAVNIPSKVPLTENNSASLPGFTLPAGFSMSIFADGVPDARVIEFDPKGRMLVSETGEGKIVVLDDANHDGKIDDNTEKPLILASGLNKPHGLAFNCDSTGACFLYVAEKNMLSRYAYDAATPSLGKRENLMPITSGMTDRHFTRSLLFLPAPNQDTLLVSVGSSCNVCDDTGDHATILSYNIKTGQKSVYAKGLRNATFMTLNPVNNKVYATDMGRDGLGDNIPPDEVDLIETKDTDDGPAPQNYGWPTCYGQNIHDADFDKKTYIRNPCMLPFEVPALVDLQAHSAPLGLAFVPNTWPDEYKYNMLVAFHGSWNRSTPTGYKVVRIKMNEKGEYLGTEDFITGWLTAKGDKSGRPVDIKISPDGTAYISDDSSGVIYRLAVNKNQ